MSTPLALILVVAAAYLAARVAFDWLGRKFLIASGPEYLVLGFLLGPQISGVLSPQVVDSFAPVITLALGWIGAVVGVQFYLPRLVRVRGVIYRIALLESTLTFLVVSGIETVVIGWLFDVGFAVAAVPAVVLGGIATASSSTAMELVRQRFSGREVATTQLGVSVLVNGIIAVLGFGLIASIWHPTVLVLGRPVTATEWVVITLAIGTIVGALFHLFVGSERDVDRLFISLAGGVILVSGAAAYVRVSPLLAALTFGAILVNTSSNREEIAAALTRVERPFYFIVLIFAGAAWRPSARQWLVPVAIFLLARLLGKIGGARLATRASGMLPVLGPDWGRALLGQGPLALAIALSYTYQENGTIPYVVFTAAIASVLLTDLISPRLVHSVLDTFFDHRHADGPAVGQALERGEG